VIGDEERCGTICISLSDLSKGKGRAPETRWDLTALGDTSVEMGHHLDGLCHEHLEDTTSSRL